MRHFRAKSQHLDTLPATARKMPVFVLFVFACDQLIGSPSVRLAAGNLKNEEEDTGDHLLQKRLRPLRQVVAMDNRCFNSHIDNTKIMFLSA